MKIYVDMDQVLVNFLLGVRRALGKELNDASLGTMEHRWERLRGVAGFWSSLEWMPNAQLIWDAVKGHDRHVLTAIPGKDLSPTCTEEKITWCREQLVLPASHVHCLDSRAGKKYYACAPWAGAEPNLLIDDHPTNVQEWRECGGLAILHRTVPETLAELKGILATKAA